MKKRVIYNYVKEVSNSENKVFQVQGNNGNVITGTKDEFINFIKGQPEVLRRLIKTNEGFKAFIRFDV